MSKLIDKIKKILFLIGPGVFLIGYNIGTGSVVTMAKSGADYGMQLFWAVVLSCVFTYVLMVAYGKTTIVTGRTALSNFRLIFQKYRIGDILSIYIIIALVIGELFSLYGILGIVADLIHEGANIIGFENFINSIWISFFVVLILYSIFWQGNYKIFEKFLMVLVAGMAICFVIVFFMVKPDYTVIARGLIPAIPDVQGATQLTAAIAGTTVSAAVFVIRSTLVAEKKWTEQNIDDEKHDAFFSAFMMLILSGIIMAVSAGTLHVMGIKLTDTVQLIHLFEPIGGKLAAILLIIGICAAGISSMFPIILIAPWLICDYRNQARDIKSPLFRYLGLGAFVFAFAMQFLGKKPPIIVVTAMTFQALILPAVVIPIFILMHNKKFMKGHENSLLFDVGLVACLIFSFITAYFSFDGLIKHFI